MIISLPRTTRAIALAGALCLLHASVAAGQGTSLVPLADPVYQDIDRLAGLITVPGFIMGQRPYSGREICRIAAAAREAVGAGEPRESAGVERQALASLEARCSAGRFPSASAVELQLAGTNAPRRSLPGTFGAPTEATIGSIGERRLGTPLAQGEGASVEVGQEADPLPWLALDARGRFELVAGMPDRSPRGALELLGLGARIRRGNLAVLLGREQTAWAQRRGDGLFLASDAPALDQISLSGDHPFRLPGVLRGLGPAQGTLLLADLGASVSHSHSRLLAYKMSVQPAPTIELGATFLNHFGGDSSRASSALDRFIDFIPLIDIFRRHNYRDSTSALDVESDKVLGVDGRVRLARLHGVTLSGEWLVDDFDVHKLSKLVTYLGSHSIAVAIPGVASPDLTVTLSAKHMGPLTYTHNALHDGSTERGRLLGDELGPDAKAFAGEAAWAPATTWSATIEARHAVYSNALYSARFVDADRTNYLFTTVSRFPDEVRDRLLATVSIRPPERASIRLRAAVQRVGNADFQGATRREFLVEAALRYQP